MNEILNFQNVNNNTTLDQRAEAVQLEHQLWRFSREVPALVAGSRTIPGGAEELILCSLEMQLPGVVGQQQVLFLHGAHCLQWARG